jgi:hypothetical protein
LAARWIPSRGRPSSACCGGCSSTRCPAGPGERQNGPLSALHAHTKTPPRSDLLRDRLRPLEHPGASGAGLAVVEHVHLAGRGDLRRRSRESHRDRPRVGGPSQASDRDPQNAARKRESKREQERARKPRSSDQPRGAHAACWVGSRQSAPGRRAPPRGA